MVLFATPPESMIRVRSSDITIYVVGVTLKWAIMGAPELIEAALRPRGLITRRSYYGICSPPEVVVMGKRRGVCCMLREKRC